MSPPIVLDRLRQQLTLELGEPIGKALDDPCVLNVFLNPDGQVWIDHVEEGMRPLGASLSADRVESLLGTIAAMVGMTVSRANPILEAILPERGFRVAGALPPVTAAPVVAIRKPTTLVVPLHQLLSDAGHLALLREAIRTHRNILISGMTGSGKTTLANSLLREASQEAPTNGSWCLRTPRSSASPRPMPSRSPRPSP
jgi:Flp pilus assembly CpaF family ATPase